MRSSFPTLTPGFWRNRRSPKLTAGCWWSTGSRIYASISEAAMESDRETREPGRADATPVRAHCMRKARCTSSQTAVNLYTIFRLRPRRSHRFARQIDMSTPNRQSACVPCFAPPTAENPALAFEPAQGTDSRSIPGLDYYGACRSANNSTGDFFKFIALDGRRLLASIGETPGPVMSPRAMMTAVQAHFPGVAASGPDSLAAAASRLNRALCDVASDGSLTTLFCACIDPLRRVLRYLSAGHESALLFRATHFSAHRLEPTGTVLGLTSRTVYRSEERRVGRESR